MAAESPPAVDAQIRALEERLRQAMLAGDVAALDALISDRLLFIGPDTRVYSKEDDLALHRSGAERVSSREVEELLVEAHGAVAVTIVLARMAGVFHGDAFAGRFRYVRTWAETAAGWQIIGGSVCAVAE